MRKSIGVCFGVKYNPELLHKFSVFFCCCKKARAFAAPSARSPYPTGTQRAAVPGRTAPARSTKEARYIADFGYNCGCFAKILEKFTVLCYYFKPSPPRVETGITLLPHRKSSANNDFTQWCRSFTGPALSL